MLRITHTGGVCLCLFVCVSCQTYEGGFGGEPCNEAHGGYTFCALAALLILGTAQHAQLQPLQVSVIGTQYEGRDDQCVTTAEGGRRDSCVYICVCVLVLCV
jgi:hypothetical protein